MEIATVIFTYNRPIHTQKVLDALAQNEQKPAKLIIFQDGMKSTTIESDWKEVSRIIQAVDWCDTEIFISKENKGLANSIISGIDYAFKNHDAVIVLEDDCVPHRQFMTYMNLSLNQYCRQKQIYSISGMAAFTDMNRESEADAYFCGRTSSCGWATWKDRWSEYERDYTIIRRIKEDREKKERLDIWGPDLESMVLGNISGTCDSWSVFWSLIVIEKDGYVLTPYESLIQNIGFDGSGVHSSNLRYEVANRKADESRDIILPHKIEISETAKLRYLERFGGASLEEKNKYYRNFLYKWIEIKQQNKKIDFVYRDNKIAFWGKGKILDLLCAEFPDAFKIECIIETYPQAEEYNGIPVLVIKEIPSYIDTIIIIPFFDRKIIKEKIYRVRPDIKNVIGIDEIIR